MAEDTKEYREWIASLSDEEKEQVDLLDAYFTFRANLPNEDPGMGTPISEPKTTEEIIDDLTPMMYVGKNVVAGWMAAHDYHITTVADGSPRWAIWRFMEVPAMT